MFCVVFGVGLWLLVVWGTHHLKFWLVLPNSVLPSDAYFTNEMELNIAGQSTCAHFQLFVKYLCVVFYLKQIKCRSKDGICTRFIVFAFGRLVSVWLFDQYTVDSNQPMQKMENDQLIWLIVVSWLHTASYLWTWNFLQLFFCATSPKLISINPAIFRLLA